MRTSGPFSPVPVVHHAEVAGASATLPLVLRTDPRPWAYAVAFARRPVETDRGSVAVRARVQVAEGRVGIGLLDRAEAGFLDEAILASSAAPVVVELLAGSDAETGPLIVRNASDTGSSVVSVLDIEGLVFAAEDDWDRPLSRPPIVPGWARCYGPHQRTLSEKARARRFAALEAPLTVAWSDGLRFRIVPDDHLSRAVFLSGTYEPNTLRVLGRLLAPGDTFVDAGANAGIVSLAASAWVGTAGRIVAIEPSGREYGRLVEHVRLNGLGQVTPVRAAVAGRSGSRRLQVAQLPRSGLNTLGGDFSVPGATLDGVEIVDAITLDDLAARDALDRIRAVKLDVEGAELEAIDGAAGILAMQRPAIVVEVCARALQAAGASVPALDARLRGFGYTLFEIDETARLHQTPALAAAPDRNVLALPAERAADAAGVSQEADSR